MDTQTENITDGSGRDRPATKREQRAASIDALLTKALTLFITQGYHATTVEEIAQSAGLTKGAVYFYFKSKANVLKTLLDRTEELTVEPTLAAMTAAGDDPTDRVGRARPRYSGRRKRQGNARSRGRPVREVRLASVRDRVRAIRGGEEIEHFTVPDQTEALPSEPLEHSRVSLQRIDQGAQRIVGYPKLADIRCCCLQFHARAAHIEEGVFASEHNVVARHQQHRWKKKPRQPSHSALPG